MRTLLNDINPSIKAITVIITVCLLTFFFEPFTPLVYCLLTILITFLFGKVAWRLYIIYFLVVCLLSVGMLWTTLAFSDEASNPEITTQFLLWELPKENVTVALSLTLRMLAFAALSFMFIFTTNMVHFILSLMQQCKLPPKLAYGILAGYRFLPLMKEELQQIRAAHRVRGANRGSGIRNTIQQYKRYAIPLLAGAIQKAERTAIAMESKGFSGEKNRTFYRQFTISWVDWLFLISMLLLLGIIVAISIKLGYFSWYKGQF